MSAQDAARAHLRGRDFDPLWRTARRALERNGGRIEGSCTVDALQPDEARALRGLLGSHGARVRLDVLDSAVLAATGLDLRAWLETVGPPLRDRPAERLAGADQRAALLASMRAHPLAASPWFETWLAAVQADGLLTTAQRFEERGYLTGALDVIDRVLNGGYERTALATIAAAATGDTKVLASATVSSLVERALVMVADVPRPTTSQERRLLWRRFGIVVDDVSSDVLVLNLPVAGTGRLARWLGEAAEAGEPFRVTLRQLEASPLTLDAPSLWVCENPSVVMDVATRLGQRAAPLVCTEGVPSDAFWSLVERCSAGTVVRAHADFDATGCSIVASVVDRAGGVPWRFDAGHYRAALTAYGAGTALPPSRGRPPATPWDPALRDALIADGRAVYEERVIDDLVDDLTR